MAKSFADESMLPRTGRPTNRRRERGVAVAAAIALGLSIGQAPIAAAADVYAGQQPQPVGTAPAVPNGAVPIAAPDAAL